MPRVRSIFNHNKESGFSAVEVLLAATVLGALVTALIGAIIYGRASTANSGDHQRATMLAEEGLDAVRNIGRASFANLVDNTSTSMGDTTIEAGIDANANGTSAYKVTATATGTVSSASAYIKTIDVALPHIQMAIYADNGGVPGTRLGVSAVQIAVANSWNIFPIGGVSVTSGTNYWLALSEDGTTNFADTGGGGVDSYDLTAGYPAPAAFSQDSTAADKPSFYMTVPTATYGLSSSGGTWAFSGTSDTNGIFTRKITVGTAGANRKVITSTVSWALPGGNSTSVTVTTQIVNWAANIKLWSNAIVGGSADETSTTDGLKVDVVGDYAYMVRNGTTSNFIVANISNPAAPSIVSTTTFSGTPTNIYVSGSYAYVTTSTATTALEIVNISNPAAPTLTKSVSMTGTAAARGIFVSGNFAYVVRASDTTTGANEFNVVDVATPASAAVVGGYNNNIQMNEVYVSGTNAYVATSSTTAEMLVINVTTSTAPALAATYNPATALAALTVTGYGNTVLLGMSTTLDAINVTAPTAPARLGTFTAAGTINDIDVDITNQVAFLGTASTTGEVQVVNIGTPASMTLAKTVDVTGTTSTVSGVAYSSSYDITVGASASDTQELIVVNRN